MPHIKPMTIEQFSETHEAMHQVYQEQYAHKTSQQPERHHNPASYVHALHLHGACFWPAPVEYPEHTIGIEYVASLSACEQAYGHYSTVMNDGACASFAGDLETPSNSFRLFAIAEKDM